MARQLGGSLTFALSAAALLVLVGCADTAGSSSTAQFGATLNGAAEVPPVTVPGNGVAAVTLDRATRTLTYSVEFAGLTGPLTGAHFHGPAAAGANAGVVVPINEGPSPLKGTALLTDPQIADLVAGKWYINLHTAANRGGEIRGQVVAK